MRTRLGASCRRRRSDDDLLLERCGLLAQLGQLGGLGGQSSFGVVVDGDHLLGARRDAPRRRYTGALARFHGRSDAVHTGDACQRACAWT